MAEPAKPRRRRAVVLGMPAVIVAVLAIVALMRVGGPPGEPGAAGTTGLNPDREASLERIEVRQLTSDRTFWAGERDEEPIFVVAGRRVKVEPGAYVSIVGTIESVPPPEVLRRQWRLNETTALEVEKRGVYVLAREIRAVR